MRSLAFPVGSTLLLATLALSSSCDTQERAGVSAETILVPADSLPPFGTAFHEDGSLGNQISGVVRVMLQDGKGRLWFGTQNGLFRHDGTDLVLYDLRDRYDQGITVKALVEDSRGDLWIGSSGGVTRFDGSHFTTFTTKQGLPSDDVWCLCIDRSGALWAGTMDGACRFDGKAFVPFPIPAASRKDPSRGVSSPHVVWDITEGRDGTLWFAASDKVYTFSEGTLAPFPVMGDRSSAFVTAILQTRDGDLWFATTSEGLLRFDGDRFTNVTEEARLGGTEIGGLFEDSSGNLWFPSKGIGLYRYDGSTFILYSGEEGLRSGAIHRATEDREGRLWAVGWIGAYRLEGDAFVNVTRDGPWLRPY